MGNLSFSTTEAQVRELFEQHGEIDSLAMIMDRDTGRFRGFAFVEMEESAADAAIAALDGYGLDERELKVNVAKPRTDRAPRGGGAGGGNRGGNRGGYGGGRY